jgi:hypothetical protein
MLMFVTNLQVIMMPNQRERGRSRKFVDLKSYFCRASSSTNPSTHGSGVGQEVDNEEVQYEQDVSGIGSTVNEFHIDHIISDPGIRIPIDQFSPNIRSEIRRAFIEKGPTQPIGHNFPKSHDKRSFQEHWFKQHNWLEYSLVKDSAYCYYCYIFRDDCKDEKLCHDTFTKMGFKQWKNAPLIFRKHVGGPSSLHNQARSTFEDIDNQRSSLKHKVITHSKDALVKYMKLDWKLLWLKLAGILYFPLVYRLIELALLLPVATAMVERAFSTMKIIKTELRNKMGDYWLNDLMVIYIERELFKGLDLQNIKKAFQKKKDKQMQLPRSPRHI